jgi:hypothetical protein
LGLLPFLCGGRVHSAVDLLAIRLATIVELH